jgi:ribonuclease M5
VLTELIVVEGVSDAQAVRRAVEAELIVTHGFALGPDAVALIRRAARVRGVVVLTDPDTAGEQIRRRVAAIVPGCRHAWIPRERCSSGGRVGVEHAPPEAILEALAAARCTRRDPIADLFTTGDLVRLRLVDAPGAQQRRAAVGARLGLGYGNGRQLLRRLNQYDVSREELEGAVDGLA